jgi:hypothetical protein
VPDARCHRRISTRGASRRNHGLLVLWDRVRELFMLDEEVAYLHSGAIGAVPTQFSVPAGDTTRTWRSADGERLEPHRPRRDQLRRIKVIRASPQAPMQACVRGAATVPLRKDPDWCAKRDWVTGPHRGLDRLVRGS